MDKNHVLIYWNRYNKEYLESLGYKFTNFRDSLIIRLDELPSSENGLVVFLCSKCGKEVKSTYGRVRNNLFKDPELLCPECQKKKLSLSYYEKTKEYCSKHNYILKSTKEDLNLLEVRF